MHSNSISKCCISSYIDPIQVGYDPTVYTTSEGEGMVELNIFVFSHPVTGAPRPFTLSVSTIDGTAGNYRYILLCKRLFMCLQYHLVTMEV